ncbi:DUF2922 domain-containing protein [Alicyclobacillus tolerans]|uniref:DUF2922 domain-containing protein n=2 Tax=Alicyclobacillus tolerans TaxID=90970 RepID=A0A1M6R3A3_9BACL|nr:MULTISPECIES: DUF2922 domain-containing protein [Alicyclobacillus]MDP9729659.1 hypothetical protein [Alicyclobacillus tengchongensis]QRF22433.1 DUF2922 domain-containing protein [Alicyclobacillus sp. TC]SHK26827.1 Protein of unknown function [Alicyclobacillus montanus]
MADKMILQMQFLTDSNKKVHINIANPKQPVDQTAVDAAMSLIVEKNIFLLPQGNIVKQVGAAAITTSSSTVG